ncbi:nitrous oxide reductase accessory protein NosL [Paenibacillus sp. B1-33]|uniref:nitrous oxide reductase accessory protein NosL n=1 Tax=unclassified Paenibacillus TaxID=185978 RepID=UPI003D2916F6
MKKGLTIFICSIIMLSMLAGCGGADHAGEKSGQAAAPVEGAAISNTGKELASQSTENKTQSKQELAAPHAEEPTHEDLCAFCQMKIYLREEDMGMFTAQMQTADGQHLYFDDVGCLLNYERDMKEKPAASWVRDYSTLEWVSAKDSTPVKAEIKTPMKYGYALFATQDAAKKFVSDNQALKGKEATWKEIDEISHQRYLKRKARMKNGGMHNDSMNKSMDHGSNGDGKHKSEDKHNK